LPIKRKIYNLNVTILLQTIQLDYKLLKNIDIFGKIDKIIVSKNILTGKRRD